MFIPGVDGVRRHGKLTQNHELIATQPFFFRSAQGTMQSTPRRY